jgi:hypothetical protein
MSVVGHFDGHGSALEQYRWHCPMWHVQGYPRSHWMPPLGNDSLRITPAAARATVNKTMTKNGPTLLAISMAAAVHWYDTAHIAQRRRSRAVVVATGCHHWVSIAANSCNWSCIRQFFQCFSSSTCRQRLWVDAKALMNNRGMTYQTKEKGLTYWSKYFMRGARLAE